VERLTHVRLRSVFSVRLHSSTILSFGLPSFATNKDCDFSGLSRAEKINENPEFELAFLGNIVSKLLGKGANGVEARRRVVSLAGEIGLNQSQNLGSRQLNQDRQNDDRRPRRQATVN
jgi:hypothetical protein